MAKIYDITLNICNGMVTYPGDPEPGILEHKLISGGDNCNLSMISLGSHTGTHVDAPRHFYANGLSIDEMSLDYFIGSARLIEIPANKDKVTSRDLADFEIKKDERLILKTRNSEIISKGYFDKNFVYLTEDAASYLAGIKIKTLGFDYLSIEKYNSKCHAVHKILLKENIPIIEGLVLKNIKQGNYHLVALPLKLDACDGSPVRAVLVG